MSASTAAKHRSMCCKIAFEPMFSAGADAFYLEDMILVTESGHEVLSAGLPYAAEEIEAVMAQGR